MYSCVLHQWNSYERMCPTCWPSGITSDSTELIIESSPTGDRDCEELKAVTLRDKLNFEAAELLKKENDELRNKVAAFKKDNEILESVMKTLKFEKSLQSNRISELEKEVERLKGFVEVVAKGQDGELMREFIGRIRKQANQLLQMTKNQTYKQK